MLHTPCPSMSKTFSSHIYQRSWLLAYPRMALLSSQSRRVTRTLRSHPQALGPSASPGACSHGRSPGPPHLSDLFHLLSLNSSVLFSYHCCFPFSPPVFGFVETSSSLNPVSISPSCPPLVLPLHLTWTTQAAGSVTLTSSSMWSVGHVCHRMTVSYPQAHRPPSALNARLRSLDFI